MFVEKGPQRQNCLGRPSLFYWIFTYLVNAHHKETSQWISNVSPLNVMLCAIEKRKKIPLRRVTFKVCKLKPANFTKSSTLPLVFFTFLKLCKWYQIAQSITNGDNMLVRLVVIELKPSPNQKRHLSDLLNHVFIWWLWPYIKASKFKIYSKTKTTIVHPQNSNRKCL